MRAQIQNPGFSSADHSGSFQKKELKELNTGKNSPFYLKNKWTSLVLQKTLGEFMYCIAKLFYSVLNRKHAGNMKTYLERKAVLVVFFT